MNNYKSLNCGDMIEFMRNHLTFQFDQMDIALLRKEMYLMIYKLHLEYVDYQFRQKQLKNKKRSNLKIKLEGVLP